MVKMKKRVYIVIKFYNNDTRYSCTYMYNKHQKEESNGCITDYPYLEALAFSFEALKEPCEAVVILPNEAIIAMRDYMKKKIDTNHYNNLCSELYNQMRIHDVTVIATERVQELFKTLEV